MTLMEAVGQQAAWIEWWLNWMLVALVLLPLVLLIWPASRWAGIATIVSLVLSALTIGWMYDQMGYVRLLGLPHLLFFTPVLIYLIAVMRRPDTPAWPKRIMAVVALTMAVSLAFDVVDVLRWMLGDRTPYPGTI